MHRLINLSSNNYFQKFSISRFISVKPVFIIKLLINTSAFEFDSRRLEQSFQITTFEASTKHTVSINRFKNNGADVEIEGLMLMMKKPNVATNSYGSIQYTGSETLTTSKCFGKNNVMFYFILNLVKFKNSLNRS